MHHIDHYNGIYMCFTATSSTVLVVSLLLVIYTLCFFFFQAEDGIRDQPRSRGLGDVYKRQS